MFHDSYNQSIIYMNKWKTIVTIKVYESLLWIIKYNEFIINQSESAVGNITNMTEKLFIN